MNEYLRTAPFDVYELHIFNLVARHGSFTKAARSLGLTQSAVTRQVKGMEESLGARLFERSTRHVRLTPAGEALFVRSKEILIQVSRALEELQQDFNLAPKAVRVGVSRSVGLAYLPGFFFKFQKEFPSVQLQVAHESSRNILQRIAERECDAGIICPPARLPREVQVVHRFKDDFTLIVPANFPLLSETQKLNGRILNRLAKEQRWLLIDRSSNTGAKLHQWLGERGLTLQPAMEMDNFDLIINLVGLGLGISIVPQRALPLYLTRRAVRKIQLMPRFSRELVVVVRKAANQPEHIRQFVESVLF